MQQCLRRNAANVEADPADRLVTLDQNHLKSEISRPERRRVPARARTDHDNPPSRPLRHRENHLLSNYSTFPTSRPRSTARLDPCPGHCRSRRTRAAVGAAPPSSSPDPEPASLPRTLCHRPRTRTLRPDSRHPLDPRREHHTASPSLTESPTSTRIFSTTPASGAGTSIVALSDSSVTSTLLGLDLVPHRDEHLDHRHVAEVTDVGNPDLAHSTIR